MGRVYSDEVRLMRTIRAVAVATLCLVIVGFALVARTWWMKERVYGETIRSLQDIRQDLREDLESVFENSW